MKKLTMLPIVCITLMFFADQAHSASLDSSGLLDNILLKFADTANYWQIKIIFHASRLFWIMAILSMVWTFSILALKNAGFSEALAEVVRFFTVTSFFWWLLINGPIISISIIKSMQQIAAEASGINTITSPSNIIDVGFDILSQVIHKSSFWSPLDSFICIIVALIILVVISLVSVNMLLLLISGWILSYGGIFLLGFGGGNWTSDIAINFYKTVLNIAIQVFAMILIVGIGKSFLDPYYTALQTNGLALQDLAVMLVISIILLSLVNKVPPMLASIIGGGGSTTGIGGFGASAAMSSAAVASMVVSKIGQAAAEGANSILGGGSAIKAAFQQAQQHMSESSGMFSGDSKGQNGSNTGGSNGFKSAMATAGKFAADMGINLAKGTTAVAKDTAVGMIDTAKDRISETAGGKVASEINKPGSSAQARQDHKDVATAEGVRSSIYAQEARDFIVENTQQSSVSSGDIQQSVNEEKQNSFSGDSLGAGKDNNLTTAINEEVAGFVNKNKSELI